jgi:hypothetical protein
MGQKDFPTTSGASHATHCTNGRYARLRRKSTRGRVSRGVHHRPDLSTISAIANFVTAPRASTLRRHR